PGLERDQLARLRAAGSEDAEGAQPRLRRARDHADRDRLAGPGGTGGVLGEKVAGRDPALERPGALSARGLRRPAPHGAGPAARTPRPAPAPAPGPPPGRPCAPSP